MGPSKISKFIGWFIVLIIALICVGGLFGAAGLALVILGTVITIPIYALRKLMWKPYPKSESVFTDEELGICNTPKKKKEEFGGDYSITGPDNNAKHIFDPDHFLYRE
jgi:hypothetical protein